MTFDCAAHSPEQEAALSRAGKAADTGTLYLDNLDQLTPGGQRVLCRLLREGVVHVQGEDTPTPVAARVIGSLTGDLAPKLEACDGLVVGSPVYYASANATLVALLTRLFYSTPFDKTMKVGAAVAAARRGGLSSTFDELNKFFTISGMPVASSQYWNSIHGRLPGEAAQDTRASRPCAPWPGTWPSWSRASPWAGRNTACRSGRSLCAPTSSAESHTRRNPWNQLL